MSNKKEKMQKLNEIFKEALDYIPDKTEEELYKGFEQEECSFGVCDGSGYILKKKDNGKEYSVWCECYQKEVLNRKMKKSNIESKYWNADFELDGLSLTLLQPKKDWEMPKMIKKGRKEVPESSEAYIKRVYKEMPIDKGVTYFGHEYSDKTIGFLNEKPKNKSKNLMIMGEPGRGKTHIACAIAKEYIKKEKTVYFTTMLSLVNDVMNPEVNIRKIMKNKDLVIVDEVGYEYHTDTKWALKQIKELFRIRYNSHLPIVCTTNFYPNELAELYDPSLISMFNGSYFYILVKSEKDYRLNEAEIGLDDFTFVEESE